MHNLSARVKVRFRNFEGLVTPCVSLREKRGAVKRPAVERPGRAGSVSFSIFEGVGKGWDQIFVTRD